MGKRELIALLNVSSWCLVMVERLFLTVPRGCLQFVIVVFPDHTHLLFSEGSEFGERNGPNPGLAGSEFGEKTGLNLGLEFRFGLWRKDGSNPGSELGFRVRRKDLA